MAHLEPEDVSPQDRPAPAARPIIVSGSADAAVRVWDLEAGRLLHPPLKGHHGKVTALAVGDLRGRAIVASGGDDRAVRMWDLASGQPLGVPLLGHRRKVRAVAVGEVHGRPIVVSGSNDNTVRVWEFDSGRQLYEPLVGHRGNVTAIAVGELRGRVIAVSASEDFPLRVWDLEIGELLGTIEGHKGFVQAVALGELGGRPIAVSGAADKTVRVWDLDNGGPLGSPLTGHRRWVRAVAVGTLAGRPIAVSGGEDQTARVWDMERAAPLGEPLVGQEAWVNAVALATVGDRTIVVSGGDDNLVRRWDLSAGERLGWPLRHDRAVNAVALADLRWAALPASDDTRRDADASSAGSVATNSQRDEETAPRPGVAGLPTAPESVTASDSPSPVPAARWEALDEASRPTAAPRWLVLALIGMVLLDLVLAVVAVRNVVDIVHPPPSSRRADGVVIDLKMDDEVYHPVIRFVTVREQVIVFTSDVGTSPPAHRIGESVKVRYDLDNPRHARLDSGSDRFWSGVLGGVPLMIALVFTLVGGL